MIVLTEISAAPDLLPELRSLLEAYGRYMYESLGLTAGRERFFDELAHLPGPAYEPPWGCFIVASYQGRIAGCAGIKKFSGEACELKRMFIRPQFRGQGIGRALCTYAIGWSRRSGYKKILLDTNVEMEAAVRLYRSCGFEEIAPYCDNENAHPVFMQYVL